MSEDNKAAEGWAGCMAFIVCLILLLVALGVLVRVWDWVWA